MSNITASPAVPSARMASYRRRMRAAGLRPVQIWVPDVNAPEFAETCRAQARAVAAQDPAGEEIMNVFSALYEWPG